MANIGATTAFYKVETSLTRANSEVSKSMERLATGRQNANAGDRASYVAMADTFRLDFVGTKAGIKGASVTMGYLETGMRVLDSASALLSRLQELAVLGANDTNTTADHEAINLEAEAIGDEFNRLMTTSTYKGRDVFNETAGSLYVAMGGRDQEMTFGIGTVDYSDMYADEARTIAGAVVTTPKAFGMAETSGIDRTATLSAGKTYIVSVTTAAAGESDYDNDDDLAEKFFDKTSAAFRGAAPAAATTAFADDVGAMLDGDVLVVDDDIDPADFNGDTDIRLREVLTGDSAFVAGQEYEIVSMGTSNGFVDIDNFSLTQTGTHSLDAGAIGRAVTAIADGETLTEGQTFTVDADATVGELAGLNALTQGMTFKQTTTTDAAFREIDASQITRNIEAVQKKINTARVQAGSQYAALESAVIYTTDLTAQYELGYNTVHDVNFSMETAHLAKNQILQQAATAMLAQANQGQQGLLQLIQG